MAPSPSLGFTNVQPLHISTQYDRETLPSDLVSPIMSKAPSVAGSDALSMVSGMTTVFPNYVSTVRPAPEYISQASASQVATQFQRAQKGGGGSISEDEDAVVEQERTVVAESAVALLNAFLDKLLYDFLSTARSTSLLALRPAVADTLRKNLGRDAVASADANLEDLLAFQDDDDEDDRPKTPSSLANRWNLEFIWKRARLRVMMRSEKSEFDIDDDERYVQEEGLTSPGRRFAESSGTITLSAEIFLAGVLDYVAEQLLAQAGAPASARAKRQSKSPRPSPSYHIIIEEPDVEKGALNSSMDRLWRTWRKSLRARALATGLGRASRFNSGVSSPVLGRRGSYAPEGLGISAVNEEEDSHDSIYTAMQRDIASDVPDMQYPEHILASNIPLPIGKRDVDEIEVPGLATDPDHSDAQTPGEEPTTAAPRRASYNPAETQYDDGLIVVDSPKQLLPTTQSMPLLTSQSSLPSSHALPVANRSFPPPSTPRAAEPATAPHELHADSYAAGGHSSAPTPAVDEMAGAWPGQPPAAEAMTGVWPDTGRGSAKEPGSPDTVVPARDSVGSSSTITAPPRNRENGVPTGRPGSEQSMTQRVQELLRRQASGGAREDPDGSRGVDGGGSADAAGGAGRDAIVAGGGVLTAGALASAAMNYTRQTTAELPARPRNVEDLDRRKSLLDMKSMIIAQDTSTDQSATRANNLGSRDQTNDMESGTAPRGSFENYTLGNSSTPQVLYEKATPQHFNNVEPSTPSNREAFGGAASSSNTPSSLPISRYSLTTPVPQSALEAESARNAPRSNGAAASAAAQGWSNSPRAVPRGYNDSPSYGRDASYADTTPFRDATSTSDFDQALASSPTLRNDVRNHTFDDSSSYYTDGAAAGRSSPRSPQRVTEEFMKTRKSSRRADAEGAAVPSDVPRKQSVRRMVVAKNANLAAAEDAKKLPLTSASITSPEDFDMFVQGDGIVKYTLTPETVRDVPSQISTLPGNRGNPPAPGEGTTRGSTAQRVMPPSLDTTNTARPPRSAAATPSAAKDAQSATSGEKARPRSTSRPPPTNAKPTQEDERVPEEPRVQTQSTGDFADFIRSTGPDKEPDTLIPLLKSRSQTSLHSLHNAHANAGPNVNGVVRPGSAAGSERTSSFTGRNTMSRSEMRAEQVPPVPTVPQASSKERGRAVMTAREAQGSVGNNDDLIDVIRTGPPAQSDRMRGAGQGREQLPQQVGRPAAPPAINTRSSNGHVNNNNTPSSSAYTTSAVPSSASRSAPTRSPVIPNTGPLPNTNGSHTVSGLTQPSSSTSPPTRHHNSSFTAPSPQSANGEPPPRKRFRNKDPYAIDFSDEDEEEDVYASLPPHRGRPEESLRDFLRNNDPPAGNGPMPINAASSAQARAILNNARVAAANGNRDVGDGAMAGARIGAARATAEAGPSTSSGDASMPPQTSGSGDGASAAAATTTAAVAAAAAAARPASTHPGYASSITSTRTNGTVGTARPAHITAQVSSAGSIPQGRYAATNRVPTLSASQTANPRMEAKGAGAVAGAKPSGSARMAAYHAENGAGGAAAGAVTGTGDLAEFLRSSGPIDPRLLSEGSGAPSPTIGKGPHSGVGGPLRDAGAGAGAAPKLGRRDWERERREKEAEKERKKEEEALKKKERKKGKFWQRRRYLDMP